MKKLSYIIIISILFSVLPTQGFSQNTGDTLGAFNVGILTPTPDRGISGVEFADGHWWVTGFDPDDNYIHKLYKINAAGDSLLETYSYGIEFAGWKDLAWDGSFLYVADIDTIRQIDITTGQKTGVKIPGPFYYQNGLAYDAEQDLFWVSGDASVIYAIDRSGDIVSSAGFINDLPVSGLSWEDESPFGPYLWIWSMKYTPDDVRPQAFQMKSSNGTLTGVNFEGVLMAPNAPYGADYALGATITSEAIPGKTVLAGLHGSSYQQNNDQLDWLVLYNIDTEMVPGPQISVTPESIQNNLMPGDSIDIDIVISNINGDYDLNWKAQTEYPNATGAVPGDVLSSFDASLLYPDTNSRSRGIAWADNAIWISTSVFYDDQFRLYKISADGSTLLETKTFYSGFGSGWRSIASDGEKIYGADTYTIAEYDISSGGITANYPKLSFSADALAYDPDEEHFFMGNGNGAIKEINKEGDEINFFVIPLEIEGLAWDKWSPGGPYLWAIAQEADNIRIVRLDPESGGFSEVAFDGINLSGDPDAPDTPEALFLSPNWQENKLVAGALQKSFFDVDEPRDKVVIYDLATTPPPGWISIVGSSFSTTTPLDSDTLTIRLNAIMEDTLMTASIVIRSNDVVDPEFVVPVNFRMMPQVATAIDDVAEKTVQIYPNPSSDFVVVEAGKIRRIRLVGMSGAILSDRIIPNSTSETIDLQGLVKGIYLLEVTHNGGTETYKVLKTSRE